MPRGPRTTSTDLIRALTRLGWTQVRQRGSHVVLKHSMIARRVVVPIHPGAILKPKTLEAILSAAGLSAEELRSLL